MNPVLKVKMPKFQTMDEIAEQYWGHWLLLTNVSKSPNGGIVVFYCKTREEPLTEYIMEMDKDFQTYGECAIRYVGPKTSVGGLFL